ncbi:hypothetical protein B0H14DRAFT_2358790 [Mycena olivaceomarginata]|nr:hypothetical protein B0H14DRAFT_2358790 [Mycena olivaceomarginata]
MDDSHAPSTYKSLTPQRKHRKLLTDGSSNAVWSESIEAVFVQGLREYWDSLWATYSRGRSRWRNQYLVDYLQNWGITRSKKQVASHIQVLQNVWKGGTRYFNCSSGLKTNTSFLHHRVSSRDRRRGSLPGIRQAKTLRKLLPSSSLTTTRTAFLPPTIRHRLSALTSLLGTLMRVDPLLLGKAKTPNLPRHRP